MINPFNGIELFSFILRKNINGHRSFMAGRPEYGKALPLIRRHLKDQERKRNRHRRKGKLIVPPMMIISVTNDCNLRCRGCYAESQCRNREEEISISELERVIAEGVELGVSLILLTGGEPLMKEGILDLVARFGTTVFVMFSNGTLITPHLVGRIKRLKNLIMAFSLEGDRVRTDRRRGEGVYDGVLNAMDLMKKEGILFGSSITLTGQNYYEVTGNEYISELSSRGMGLIFYVEYVPSGGDEEMCLSQEQKSSMLRRCARIKRSFPLMTIPMAGYQRLFGGCLAAGRGLIHISSTGTVEACPFSPWSDTNIKDCSLEDALRSPLINRIRENHRELQGAAGGCALSENGDWVRKLMTSGA